MCFEGREISMTWTAVYILKLQYGLGHPNVQLRIAFAFLKNELVSMEIWLHMVGDSISFVLPWAWVDQYFLHTACAIPGIQSTLKMWQDSLKFWQAGRLTAIAKWTLFPPLFWYEATRALVGLKSTLLLRNEDQCQK